MFSSNLLFSNDFFCDSVSSSCSQISVNLFHLPDDLLLEDRQDGVIVANFLEHYTTVKLVTHFLEVEPAQKKQTCQLHLYTYPRGQIKFLQLYILVIYN